MVTLDLPKAVLEREPQAGLIESVLAHFRKGNSLFDEGRFEAALKEYDAALQLVPTDPTLLNNRAATLNSLRQYEEALTILDHVLQLKPRDAAAWHNRGVTLVRLNRLEEALAAYQRALEIAPDDVGTLANRGLVQAHLGHLREALADLDRALLQRSDDQQLRASRKLVLDELMQSLEREGVLSWAGGKPTGSVPAVSITRGPPISDYVIEDRR
jgi:tetratricopeptide (TPR) repeat protein